ncbi:40S ribosomal protein S11 [Sesamum angolense]|uniref:40S ribosomal protein S11 n=1 Tax=Sesamum angolense TaxID=2727404 RepID=A0AAE1XCG0_9LAMI|nr:40S ribosomal protein S11 [Sesamum angolense]
MAERTEKAFLKQPKKSGKGKAPGKGGNRYWKSIGLGFKTPREAVEGQRISRLQFYWSSIWPASDTQKRLEKETGAKIRVYGTKADTGGKVEVTPTDGKEIDNAYEDLYVHVSADTFEKVDAAVALIELLVTPVSVNPMSASTTSTAISDDNVNTHLSQSTPNSIIAPALINQGTAQPFSGSLPPSQGQFPQYPQTWFPAGPTQTPTQHNLD